jgi:hypothetical protein
MLLSVLSKVGSGTSHALAPLPVALAGGTYSSGAGYWVPPSSSSSGNFFPEGAFPNGLWQSTPGNCNDWDPSQSVLTAQMQPYAYDGYAAMALSGSYGNACETQNINLPSSVTGGGTFIINLYAETQGPLSAGPSMCIWTQNECAPISWSPQPSNVSTWTNFIATVTMPASYVPGDSATLFLYSGETNGGPAAVNAYADIQMFT